MPPTPTPTNSECEPFWSKLMAEYPWLTIHDAQAMLRKGEISSVELTQTLLDRVLALDNAVRAYVSLQPKHEWDVCAGVALVLAAGGRVTNLDGRPILFNQPDVRIRGIVAANATLHAGLMETLRGGNE